VDQQLRWLRRLDSIGEEARDLYVERLHLQLQFTRSARATDIHDGHARKGADNHAFQLLRVI
jgi:hypothetical protein